MIYRLRRQATAAGGLLFRGFEIIVLVDVTMFTAFY
jgi:hypothetical protein